MKAKITSLVKEILTNNPETRNSDYWLWREVIRNTDAAPMLKNWTVEEFLKGGFNLVPHFETVSRARRKVQAKYPELRGCEEVQVGRSELEEQYREYARDERAI